MNGLVFMACQYNQECLGYCKKDCEVLGRNKEKLQKFGREISKGLAGKEAVIAEMRKEKWYQDAVKNLHRDSFIVENNTFKIIEENLINGLLGMWAHK